MQFMCVGKVNTHGTVNPRYKIRRREWNEIGKEAAASGVSAYISEGGRVECVDLNKVDGGIKIFHTFLYF